MDGQLQATLVNEFLTSDTYYIDWDGSSGMETGINEGLYIVRLSSGTTYETKKILKLK
jgi:hypothetical protein